MIIPFKMKKYVPTGLSFHLANTIDTISRPPVEAPNFSVKPMPIAEMTPPNTVFRRISCDSLISGRIPIKTDVIATLNMLYTVNDLPTFSHPNTPMGMFKRNMRTPVEI